MLYGILFGAYGFGAFAKRTFEIGLGCLHGEVGQDCLKLLHQLTHDGLQYLDLALIILLVNINCLSTVQSQNLGTFELKAAKLISIIFSFYRCSFLFC